MQIQTITEISRPANIIRLPNTCPGNRRQFAHIKLLTEVSADAWCAAGFQGTLHQPGAQIPAPGPSARLVALEFAGPQGTWKCRRRENLWILWRYDQPTRSWREIAQALAFGWEWAPVLRGPAIQAMRPRAPEADPRDRGREVSEQVLAAIDSALAPELPAVRKVILCAIYDRMAGCLAAAA